MTAAEAQVVVDVLLEGGQPSTLSWGVQVLEYGRVLRGGPLEAQARVLASLYSVENPDSPQLLMITRFEEKLLAPVAEALGRPQGELRALVRGGRAASTGDAPWRQEASASPDAAPTAPAGWTATGAFRVFGNALVFGEAPHVVEAEEGAEAVATFLRPAVNGLWFTWSVPANRGLWRRLFDRDALEETEQIAIHESALSEASTHLRRAVSLGTVWVHGGTSSAVDAEVRSDRQFRSNLEAGVETGRSFTVGPGGDGEVTWRGTTRDGKLVLVVLRASS